MYIVEFFYIFLFSYVFIIFVVGSCFSSKIFIFKYVRNKSVGDFFFFFIYFCKLGSSYMFFFFFIL